MARIYVTFDRFGDAIPWLRQEAEFRRRSLGISHPRVASILNHIAVWLLASGDAVQAESILVSAIQRCLPTDRFGYRTDAVLRLNLAHLLSNVGRESEAESQLNELLDQATTHRHLEPDIRGAIDSLLARIAMARNDMTSAEHLALSSYEQFQLAVNWNAETQLPLLQTKEILARLKLSRGEVKTAEQLLMEILRRGKRLGGQHHVVLADARSSLAQIEISRGNWKEAEKLLRDALSVNPQGVGSFRPGLADLLLQLVWVEACRSLSLGQSEIDAKSKQQYLKAAQQHLEQLCVVANHQLFQILAMNNEHQRLEAADRTRSVIDFVLSFALKFPSLRSSTLAFDLVQRRKLAIAELMSTQQNTARTARSPEIQSSLLRLQQLREQIAVEMFRIADHSTKTGNRTLEYLLVERQKLERTLASQLPELLSRQKIWDADRRAVALALPEKTALLEFVSISLLDFETSLRDASPIWRERRYLAFVLRSGLPDSLQLIDLGPTEEIDRWIHLFREELFQEGESSGDRSARSQNRTKRRDMQVRFEKQGQVPTNSREIHFAGNSSLKSSSQLTKKLWGPIESVISKVDKILIAPDGDLAMLPWDALPSAPGVSPGLNREFHYCSVGREVLRFGRKYSGPTTDPVVVADPDFGAVPTPHSGSQSRSANRLNRELSQSCVAFPALPGTRLEGEIVSERLGVPVWKGNEALEPRVRRRVSPRILHLATHGFYIQRDSIDESSNSRGKGSNSILDRWKGIAAENPMLRSGLALAGANDWIAQRPLHDRFGDGVLLADEVSVLNLQGTQLVVLSACDSGCGDTHWGEGVLGLRRSFFVAGAQTLVISLWSVADFATVCLMDEFYHQLSAGRGCADALRIAQRVLRESTVSRIRNRWQFDPSILQVRHELPELWTEYQNLVNAPSDHYPFSSPYYWAAFVCVGDPGPLTFPIQSGHTSARHYEKEITTTPDAQGKNMTEPQPASMEPPQMELPSPSHSVVEMPEAEHPTVPLSDPNPLKTSSEPLVPPREQIDLKLDQIQERQEALQRFFEQKILIDQTRQQLLDKLHTEMQDYKADLLLKTLQPMALDLIKLQDDIGKLSDAHRPRSEGNEAASALVNLIDQLGDEVRDILTRFGFEPFVVPENKFDGKRQRVVKRIPTSDSTQDQAVIVRVRPGFMYENRVLRPELVHVAVFEAQKSS